MGNLKKRYQKLSCVYQKDIFIFKESKVNKKAKWRSTNEYVYKNGKKKEKENTMIELFISKLFIAYNRENKH